MVSDGSFSLFSMVRENLLMIVIATLTVPISGHIGNTTADYAERTLTPSIRATLQEFIGSIGGRLDRSNIATHAPQVTALLKNEIEMLDQHLGDVVREVCPRPEELTQEQARRLIEEHHDVLRRAFSGTTVAFTLIEVDQRFMWAAGVGDSSIGEHGWLTLIGGEWC